MCAGASSTRRVCALPSRRSPTHFAHPSAGVVGCRDHGLRFGRQEVRRLGPEPADRVAHPLPRPGHHGLLARGEKGALHLLAGETLLLFGSRGYDRGGVTPLHRDGGREELRRYPRAERGGVRLLPPARLPADAPLEWDHRQRLYSARQVETPATIPISSRFSPDPSAGT